MKKKFIRRKTKHAQDCCPGDWREQALPGDLVQETGTMITGGGQKIESWLLHIVCLTANDEITEDDAAVEIYREIGLWMCDGHHIHDDYPVSRLESLFECHGNLTDSTETAKAAKRLAKKIRSAGLEPLEKGSLRTANDIIRAVYYAPERRELCWDDDDLYTILRLLVTHGTPRYQVYFARAIEYAWLVIDTFAAENNTQGG